MLKYAEFNKENSNSKKLENIIYRKAIIADSFQISQLIYNRERENSSESLEFYIERTKKEFDDNEGFFIIVAELDAEIIGFGRIMYFDLDKTDNFHSKYSGWYLMGIIVKTEYRRCGVGNNLIEKRINLVKNETNEIYYIVNSRNRASLVMHEKFGFKKIIECSEFMKIKFDGGKGFLCCKKLS